MLQRGSEIDVRENLPAACVLRPEFTLRASNSKTHFVQRFGTDEDGISFIGRRAGSHEGNKRTDNDEEEIRLYLA
jgi:hypothetical protein